jgi:hypothetical protein
LVSLCIGSASLSQVQHRRGYDSVSLVFGFSGGFALSSAYSVLGCVSAGRVCVFPDENFVESYGTVVSSYCTTLFEPNSSWLPETARFVNSAPGYCGHVGVRNGRAAICCRRPGKACTSPHRAVAAVRQRRNVRVQRARGMKAACSRSPNAQPRQPRQRQVRSHGHGSRQALLEPLSLCWRYNSASRKPCPVPGF